MSLLKSLLEEVKELITLKEEVSLLKEKVKALENGTPLPPPLQTHTEIDRTVSSTPEVHLNQTKITEEQRGNIYYFECLQRNEDGEYYVDADCLHSSPDNYKLIINGEQADAYITEDKSKNESMLANFRKYLFPLKRPASDPTADCGLTTVEPGRLILKGDKWIVDKKITINYI